MTKYRFMRTKNIPTDPPTNKAYPFLLYTINRVRLQREHLVCMQCGARPGILKTSVIKCKLCLQIRIWQLLASLWSPWQVRAVLTCTSCQHMPQLLQPYLEPQMPHNNLWNQLQRTVLHTHPVHPGVSPADGWGVRNLLHQILNFL